jgi:hypothetical protein
VAVGCGGKQLQDRAKVRDAAAAQGGIARGDDLGRCEYKGRADREVEETASANAIQPNIRRVFSVVGEGEEVRRVLLCREVDTNLDGVKDVVRTYTDKGDALYELVDSDFDGRVDTWTTFATGRVAEVKIDRNRDGKPDEKRVYIQGRKSRAELDANFDGKPDVWEIYEEARLARRGVDLDGDGHVDRWDRDLIAQREEEEREQRDEEARQQKPAEPASSAAPEAAAPPANPR